MINEIKIEGLKSIHKLQLDLRKLNLLVGTNSAGKSTVIQSILVASQNLGENHCNFNGSLVSMGDFREMRNFVKNSQYVSIDIRDNKGIHSWKFTEDEVIKSNVKEECCQLNFDQDLYYLSAARIGYMDIYEKNTKEMFKFGLQGEYCLSYFEQHKTDNLVNKLVYDGISQTLDYNVNYWLNYIVSGKVVTLDVQQTDKIKVLFSGASGRAVRTKNIGSGLSYLVSIIIMCLSAKEGDTIIIENPEIHLHPKAQSRLCDFFVFIAKANVQLVIETHSDHIFNGMRVAKVEESLGDEEMSINFLMLDEENCSVNYDIKIGKRGRVLDAPKDLFEQFEIDLDRMLGI